MLLIAARSRHSVGLRCGPLCGTPAAAYPVSRSANAASVEQFLVRLSIAHLHASDWRNASGAMPPVARDFRVYFALVQSPEEGHCTKRRKSGASASNDHRTSEKRNTPTGCRASIKGRYAPKSRSHPYTCDVARRFTRNRVRLRPARYPPIPQFLAARGRARIFGRIFVLSMARDWLKNWLLFNGLDFPSSGHTDIVPIAQGA